ncbi:hypothetical protein OAH16_00345 [bacterium]|nr:hypothetical protein [bacterium]
MNRSYCTLFDKNYLFQGVALYRSLVLHAGNFKLYVLCMDQVAHAFLSKMNLANLIPLSVEDMLTPELAEVRKRTTHGQFCWVCQPIICQYVLDRFGDEMVTYLESDSLFFSSPETLFEELGNRSVSLVPHNYSSEFDNSAAAGKFCVQFNAFRNDATGHEVLAYWRDWCFKYDKSAPNVYPGQTILDDWPKRFDGVAVIAHKGAGVAPWNIRGYELTIKDFIPHVNGVPVVFYHYHQYGRLKSGAHELGSYLMTKNVIDFFYRPYVIELRQAELAVRTLDPSFVYRREYADSPPLIGIFRLFSLTAIRAYLSIIKRKVRGRYNVYPDAYFKKNRVMEVDRD